MPQSQKPKQKIEQYCNTFNKYSKNYFKVEIKEKKEKKLREKIGIKLPFCDECVFGVTERR